MAAALTHAYASDDPSRAAAVWRALILATCTGVTFLYAMTVSIANVSLPQMQGALSATADQISWVVTINIVATAVATPMSGWLVERFGRRYLILGCVLFFGLASLLCGLADSLTSLVFYRACQGAFGAPLVPVSQAIIIDTFPKRQHGAAIAIFGMGAVFGPVVGPVVGGYLSETYNWRWVFFMILPFTVAALFAAWVFIHDKSDVRQSSVRLDWTGFLSLAVGLAMLQLTLDRGERQDWFESSEIIAYMSVAALGFYTFIAHTLTTEQPFLRPALLRDRNYAVGLIIVFIFGMLNFTPMTILPSVLQKVSGYPDSVIGFILGARGSGTLIAFFLMIWAVRIDARILLTFGFLLQAYAGWAMTGVDVNVGVWDIFWPVFWQGFGVGVLWVPITVVTFSTLKREWVAEGTAVYHLLRNMGSSIHIAISLALALRMTKINYAELSEQVSDYNENFELPWVVGRYGLDNSQNVAALASEIQRQATMIGFIDASYFFVFTALAALPLVALIKLQRTNDP